MAADPHLHILQTIAFVLLRHAVLNIRVPLSPSSAREKLTLRTVWASRQRCGCSPHGSGLFTPNSSRRPMHGSPNPRGLSIADRLGLPG